MSEQVEQWLVFTNEDLHVAEILLKEEIYTQSCFHAQQCVEKFFKSVLVQRGVSVPRTHSVVTLFKLLPATLVSNLQNDVSIFDDFYMATRYPDMLPGGLPDGPPSKNEAKDAVNQAQEIAQLVKQWLTSNSQS